MPPTTEGPATSAITVVIPTKDRAGLLAETLRSLREQTLPPERIVVADDGSTDATEDVARAAGAAYLFKEGGGWGVAGGRNAGFEAVTTEYVAFVDSDDLLRPHAHEVLHAALERRPDAPFAYGRALTAHRGGVGWHPDGLVAGEPSELDQPLCSLFSRNRIHSSGGLLRTAAVRAVGAYDPRVRFSEDHHLWVRLASVAKPVACPEVLSVYRHHRGNIFAPAEMIGDRAAFMALADADPRLAPCRSAWVGVHLLETLAETARLRRPADLGSALGRLIVRERDRRAVVAACIEHFHRRRRLWRAGERLWADDVELREWIATFK